MKEHEIFLINLKKKAYILVHKNVQNSKRKTCKKNKKQ